MRCDDYDKYHVFQFKTTSYYFASVVIPSAWIEECNDELKWDNEKMTSKAPSASTSSCAAMIMINIMFFNSRLHQDMLIEG